MFQCAVAGVFRHSADGLSASGQLPGRDRALGQAAAGFVHEPARPPVTGAHRCCRVCCGAGQRDLQCGGPARTDAAEGPERAARALPHDDRGAARVWDRPQALRPLPPVTGRFAERGLGDVLFSFIVCDMLALRGQLG